MRSTVVCNSTLHRQVSVAAGRSIDCFDVLISNNCSYSGRTLYSHRERNKIDNFILQEKHMIKLKYGNTNTFFIKGTQGGLLIDTDYAGTLTAFYKAMKTAGIKVSDIKYVLATHYHPDHMGLVGQLTTQGAKLLLLDLQKPSVHFSDKIFEQDKLPFSVINEADAETISCEESRKFLSFMGISGEIVHTPSHSEDSISLILDDGSCFVGDLEPLEYLEAYDSNLTLKNDWDRIMSYRPNMVYFAHRPEKKL